MADPAFIQVASVKVEKLFSLYDHTIQLKLDERVTIVHGPNGVGKTWVLRLVAALFGGRITEFCRVPMKRFEVALTDGSSFAVEPGTGRPRSATGRQPGLFDQPLKLTYRDPSGVAHPSTIEFDDPRFSESLMMLERELPWLERLAEDKWIDNRTGRILSSPEILSRFADLLPPRRKTRHRDAEPEWFPEISGRVRVHLIEAQRLLRLGPTEAPRGRGQTMVATVRDYAQDLHRRVNETLARYASDSQTLDQSFPQRLLVASGPALGIAAIKDRMSALDAKRTKLRSLGILDDGGVYPFDIASLDKLEQTQANVMSLYVQDTEKKLGGLDDLSRRIELLRDNVNRKFANKSIRIDRENGFSAVGHDGTPLDLESLSSGEQHELVLLYDLLFRVQPNTLVLIDEPELSLHVGWQKRFLPDLLEIVKTAQFDALVATHSPFIVGDRSDLMVPLGTDTE